MERGSSEEDDDRETLIRQNNTQAHNLRHDCHREQNLPETSVRRSTFDIEDYSLQVRRRCNFSNFHKSNNKKPSCFYSIPQAADCISRVVERVNAPVIYLSTDAAESETGLLQSLLVLNGKSVPLVKRPHRNSAEKWDALLYRHRLEDDSQVEAMLDKTICAMSNVFIGASGSTFTEDILRLRKGWRLASLCDEYLCQGEDPSFKAEDE